MYALANWIENVRIDMMHPKNWEVTPKFYAAMPALLMIGGWIGFLARV
ncbi:hypothetical protein [Pseudoxanthomonas winnipegensis]|nr:hypothetical protein [Pseudoxanthomonas winnipegensis]